MGVKIDRHIAVGILCALVTGTVWKQALPGRCFDLLRRPAKSAIVGACIKPQAVFGILKLQVFKIFMYHIHKSIQVNQLPRSAVQSLQSPVALPECVVSLISDDGCVFDLESVGLPDVCFDLFYKGRLHLEAAYRKISSTAPSAEVYVFKGGGFEKIRDHGITDELRKYNAGEQFRAVAIRGSRCFESLAVLPEIV